MTKRTLQTNRYLRARRLNEDYLVRHVSGEVHAEQSNELPDKPEHPENLEEDLDNQEFGEIEKRTEKRFSGKDQGSKFFGERVRGRK